MDRKNSWTTSLKYLSISMGISIFMQHTFLEQPAALSQISLPQPELPEVENFSVPELPSSLVELLPNEVEPPQNPLTDFQIPTAETTPEGKPLKDLKDKQYWTSYCNQAVLGNDTATALIACDRAITLQPKKTNLWANRSKILLDLKQYTAALAAADYTLQLEPKHSLGFTYRSMALTGLGQYRAAIDASEAALRLDSYWSNGSPALAWHYQGLALYKLEKYQLAANAYSRALTIAPENSITLARKCQVLSALGKQQTAIDTCQQALNIDRNWGDFSPALAWNFRGLALARSDRQEEAILSYDRALRHEPENPITWTYQGVSLSELDRHQEALNSYQQAIAIKPDFSFALVNRCKSHNQLKQYQTAVTNCQKALAGDGFWGKLGATQAWNQLGVAFNNLGQYREALVALNRSVGIEPDNEEAWNNRGVTLWYLEEYPQASASFKRAIAINPEDPSPWQNLGRVYRSDKQYTAALEAYDRALAIDADNTEGWINRSVISWYLQDYPQALQDLNTALDLDPELFVAWYNQGNVLISLARYSEAISAYERAISLEQKNPQVWAAKGFALKMAGNISEATAACAKATKLNRGISFDKYCTFN